MTRHIYHSYTSMSTLSIATVQDSSNDISLYAGTNDAFFHQDLVSRGGGGYKVRSRGLKSMWSSSVHLDVSISPSPYSPFFLSFQIYAPSCTNTHSCSIYFLPLSYNKRELIARDRASKRKTPRTINKSHCLQRKMRFIISIHARTHNVEYSSHIFSSCFSFFSSLIDCIVSLISLEQKSKAELALLAGQDDSRHFNMKNIVRLQGKSLKAVRRLERKGVDVHVCSMILIFLYIYMYAYISIYIYMCKNHTTIWAEA